MTDFRAALQKLLNEVHDLRLEAGNPSLRSAVTKARAALAEQPVGPTDEELEYRIAAALRTAADCLTDATSAHTLYAIADELEQ